MKWCLTSMRVVALALVVLYTTSCSAPDAASPPAMPPAPPTPSVGMSAFESWAEAARGPSETRIAMTARAASADGEPAITFTVTNISGKGIRLWPFQLPWGNLNSVDVAAMTADGRTLEMGYPIDDPGFEQELVIAPGQTLSGVYRLDQVMKLGEWSKKSDVIVLWCYKLDRQDSAVSTGVLVF